MPRSRIPPAAVHKKACVVPRALIWLQPVTCPLALMAVACTGRAAEGAEVDYPRR